MISFDKLIVTGIRRAFIVHSKKGHYYKQENRPSFGISFCMSGQITYTMGEKTYVSNPNCVVLLPQGSTYSLVGDSEGLFPVINFSCTGLDCTEITLLPMDDPQSCIQRFKTLRQLLLRNESRMKIYSAFYDLLAQLDSSEQQDADWLDFVTQYIEEHIQDPALSNVDLAKHMGISEVYLRKLFRNRYHITPKQYILDIRIRKAKQLLVDTPFTVAAIAEECGFTSLYHFCRSFKQRTGITPTQYAAENKTYQI